MSNSLIIDNRAAVKGPGLHALIVGVSEYDHLPDHDDPPDPATWDLKKLGAPALSAFRLKDWLEQAGATLASPLKTCRLLLSPSETELTAEPALRAFLTARANLGPGNDVPLATRSNFQIAASAWRKDAMDDPENVTFFYFGGHGIQLGPEEAIMMFADIFEPDWTALDRCARFSNVRNGMAPSAQFAKIANRQFYFVDCCRYMPDPAKNLHNPQPPDVFDVAVNTLDRREAPVYFATVDGSVATGWRGRETVFARALLHGLGNGADDPEDDGEGGTTWPVKATSLKVAMERHMTLHGPVQDIVLSSLVKDPVLVNLAEPPRVDVEVEILPTSLLNNCAIAISDQETNHIFNERPWQTERIRATGVTAGPYNLRVTSDRLRVSPYSKLIFINNRFKVPWRHNLSSVLTPPVVATAPAGSGAGPTEGGR
ncbi:hypothetical protein N825_22900 [Skermanella stibiiresistens SB22]|uniref:Peptidase C14 caspase domain-containing protein n=1 Tax=Skermanella stibiiresistens SB22 TaxID=1385369 RepID=W9GT59_9PROT|nr:caspase family protein [Skermanella stibiiresistens]EWY36964.1 hypothetical protein N825_22900 [Skermanella stibiiresistens SB22]